MWHLSTVASLLVILAAASERNNWTNCPNQCYEEEGNGVCANNFCKCNSSWSGVDCSIPACVSSIPNSCSRYGTCSKTLNRCICDNYHCMSDCSADAANQLAPVADTFNGTEYSSADKFGNDHPIFNRSTIAQLYVEMSPNDYMYLNMNLSNRIYMDATLSFNNGIIEKQNFNIGIKLQGAASRGDIKKSWKVKFEEKWHHTKGFSLKATPKDVSFLRERFSMALLESMASPVYRGGYAVLYINRQFFGLYHMLEIIDDDFLKSRFGTDNGLLCKYPTLPLTLCDLKLAEFNMMLKKVNHPGIDWSYLLRVIVYESISQAGDGYLRGNNYYIFFNDETKTAQLFRHDLDTAFGVMYAGNGVSVYPPAAPFLNSTDNIQRKYEAIYCDFLRGFYNPSSTLITHLSQLHQMILRPASLDLWQPAQYQWTFDDVTNSLYSSVRRKIFAAGIVPYIQQSYQQALKQLQC